VKVTKRVFVAIGVACLAASTTGCIVPVVYPYHHHHYHRFHRHYYSAPSFVSSTASDSRGTQPNTELGARAMVDPSTVARVAQNG
jgi:hypothetical protein